MGRILVLGGTGDALTIARRLQASDVYSLAGLGKVPDGLACRVRVGGFGGSEGLARFLETERIALVVDATHPYAAQMSANAASASKLAGVNCWALRRPPWEPRGGDDWRWVANWDAIRAELAPFARPFFTLGREPLSHLADIPAHQYWTIRCLDAHPGTDRARVIGARGPFTLDGERALFEQNRFDVVVSKNSGGAATEAKLDVARERGLPVVMLRRPSLPAVARIFETTDALLAELDALREPIDDRMIRPGS
nr:cobalt-precorrin-6A reductase [Trinickia diaoshuihuensis]